VGLRFDWYPIVDHEVMSNKTSIIVELVSKRRITKGTKEKVESTTIQILSALYLSYFSLPKGSTLVSLPLSSGHYSNSNYSYRVIKDIFNCLCELKWVEFDKGTEDKKKVTRIWAVGELASAFDTVGLLWFPQQPNPKESLVVLRDFLNPKGKTKKERGPKVDLEVPELPEVESYRTTLYQYNQFLLQHCISLELDDENLNQLANEMVQRKKDKKKVWATDEEERIGCLDLSRVQLRRIFSRGSLEKGGRYYGGFWQSIPSSHRPHLRIDGKKTIEMDYSSMALRIIYAQEGHEVSKDVDLYDIGLPNWRPEKDPRRKPIKTYINAVINDESGKYRLPKEDLDIIGISHKELHKLVLNSHEPIEHLFSSGEGLNAQFVDSQIAELVMEAMMFEEIVVLPIHDSFIVRVGYAGILHEEMNKAFEMLTGAKTTITEAPIKANAHFGLNDEELVEATSDIEKSVVDFGSEEVWEAFIRDEIMDRYFGSWKCR
jgi:hypothetical protein